MKPTIQQEKKTPPEGGVSTDGNWPLLRCVGEPVGVAPRKEYSQHVRSVGPGPTTRSALPAPGTAPARTSGAQGLFGRNRGPIVVKGSLATPLGRTVP